MLQDGRRGKKRKLQKKIESNLKKYAFFCLGGKAYTVNKRKTNLMDHLTAVQCLVAFMFFSSLSESKREYKRRRSPFFWSLASKL